MGYVVGGGGVRKTPQSSSNLHSHVVLTIQLVAKGLKNFLQVPSTRNVTNGGVGAAPHPEVPLWCWCLPGEEDWCACPVGSWGLTVALVAMKIHRLLQAEACTVRATIENKVFSAFEASSSGCRLQWIIEPSFDLFREINPFIVIWTQ